MSPRLQAGSRRRTVQLQRRTPAQGVVQLVPINRNANHAGGSRKVEGDWVPYHGWFVTGGESVHPNSRTIGIEVHAGGYLGRARIGGEFVHPDTGRTIPRDQVYLDSRGIGWHKITEYQIAELALLVDALDAAIAPTPADATIVPNGTYADNGARWAQLADARIVGHVTSTRQTRRIQVPS